MDLLILVIGIVLLIIGQRNKSNQGASKVKIFTIIGVILIIIGLIPFTIGFVGSFTKSFDEGVRKSQAQHN